MPTTIDRLVVELGLDPRKFTQGQKEALSSFKSTQEELARRGKDVEHGSKSIAQSFSTLKAQALGLLAVFTGGRSLTSFTTGVGAADIAVGRLSRSTGESIANLSAWQGAARLAGGDAADAATSIKTLTDVFEGWKIGIVSGSTMATFRSISAAGGQAIIDGATKGAEQSIYDLADNLRAIWLKNKGQASVLANQIPGMTQTWFDLLVKGSAEMKRLKDEATSIGGATKESEEAARKLNLEFTKTVLLLEQIGRIAIVNLVKPITEALQSFKRFNELWSKGEYKKAVAEIVTFDTVPGTVADTVRKNWNPTMPRFQQGSYLDRLFNPTEYESDAEPPEVWGQPKPPDAAPPKPVPVKPDAGVKSEAVDKLASDIQSTVPGIKQFTAFDDQYHSLLGGAHPKGRALDFTLKNPEQAAEIADQIRVKLKSLGIDATVIDHYNDKRYRSTAPHIHVQINSAAAAQRYLNQSSSNSSSTSNVTNITGTTVVVNTPQTDGAKFAGDLKARLELTARTAQAQTGQG